MAEAKYYAVKIGKVPGIYRSWDACKAMVHGFPGAVYKSFKTMEEAESFLGGRGMRSNTVEESQTKMSSNVVKNSRQGKTAVVAAGAPDTLPEIYAFVDGSYNIATKVYGYGGFLIHNGEKEILQGSGKEEEMSSMRNVAGEVLGSVAAIERAVELSLPEITIYYDYMGIEMWADGSWKRNKKGTVAYYDYIQSVKDKIKIHFVKVKGHSGVEGNEEADRLAKKAVGILT